MTTRDIGATTKGHTIRRSLSAQRALLYEDRLGTIAHQVIARLLTYDLPLTDIQAARATDAVIGPSIAPVYRASIRAWVTGAVVRYQKHFRRSAQWSFLGAEAILGHVALDLLWVSSRGSLEADELKTGTSPASRLAESLAQARNQAHAAAKILGPSFRGVRLVVVTNPELSAVVAPDGSLRPLLPSRCDAG